MKIKKQHLLFWAFAVVLLLLFVLDVTGETVAFSDMENRYLKTRPNFSLKALFSAKYTADYEAYVDDQFVFRETWMKVKSSAERILLKKENNDIVFGKDGYLFNKFLEVPVHYQKNLAEIKAFSERYTDATVRFALAPNSYAVLSDKVPEGLYNVDQQAVMATNAEKLGPRVQIIDLYEPLEATRDAEMPLYFKTDHHWSLYGAYTGYAAYANAIGASPVPFTPETIQSVPDFYGTFFSAAKRFNSAPDTLYYDAALSEAYTITIGDETPSSIYDLSFTKGRDKYGLFLHNNPPLITLENKAPDAKGRLLVFKDSYANSFLPYAAQHYAKVDIVDLRYFNGTVTELMKAPYDDVLFMYNFITFSQDKNLIKLRF